MNSHRNTYWMIFSIYLLEAQRICCARETVVHVGDYLSPKTYKQSNPFLQLKHLGLIIRLFVLQVMPKILGQYMMTMITILHSKTGKILKLQKHSKNDSKDHAGRGHFKACSKLVKVGVQKQEKIGQETKSLHSSLFNICPKAKWRWGSNKSLKSFWRVSRYELKLLLINKKCWKIFQHYLAAYYGNSLKSRKADANRVTSPKACSPLIAKENVEKLHS